MPKKNKLLAVGVLILALAFGSFQEKLKISVNNILRYSQQVSNYNTLTPESRQEKVLDIIANTPRDFYSHQSAISWFYKLSIPQLSKLKWINTVLFVLVHLMLNVVILYLLFGDKNLLKIVGLSYAAFFIIALIIFALGKVLHLDQPGYNVARKIVGALQSQVPLMIFFIANYLNIKTRT